MAETVTNLTLVTVDGPAPISHTVTRDHPCSIGRLKDSDLCLLHENVSRQHAQVLFRSGAWFIVDLDSKWGSFLNGVRLTRHKPAALAGGDLLRIGPWTLRVQGLAHPTSTIGTSRHTTTIEGTPAAGQRIERTSGMQGAWKSDRRLKLLMECLTAFADELDEATLAATAIELLVAGSGYARGAVLRRPDEGAEVEIVASWPTLEAAAASASATGVAPPVRFEISRSLLQEAMSGQAVVLTGAAPFAPSQSVSEMRIHSAICVPVMLGGTVVGFLYLDARGRESTVQADAATFCEAVAAAYSLALANVKRVELEGRDKVHSAEFAAARAVQEQLSARLEASVGEVSYAARTQPGLFVAGDIFDVLELPDGRVAAIVGDVSGRGIAAGLHMATVQAFLHAELIRGVPLAATMDGLNDYLCKRVAPGRFVSLWLGAIGSDGTVEYVDAGHGYWLIQRRDGTVLHAIDSDFERDLTLGVEAGYRYKAGQIALGLGERLVLYTDGVIEQRGRSNEQFKRHRLGEALPRLSEVSGGPAEALERCYKTLLAFAERPELDDDSTVIVVQRRS
jgi:sigma-B regulation protein RsbU (phosphoserine phosphatase)